MLNFIINVLRSHLEKKETSTDDLLCIYTYYITTIYKDLNNIKLDEKVSYNKFADSDKIDSQDDDENLSKPIFNKEKPNDDSSEIKNVIEGYNIKD